MTQSELTGVQILFNSGLFILGYHASQSKERGPQRLGMALIIFSVIMIVYYSCIWMSGSQGFCIGGSGCDTSNKPYYYPKYDASCVSRCGRAPASKTACRAKCNPEHDHARQNVASTRDINARDLFMSRHGRDTDVSKRFGLNKFPSCMMDKSKFCKAMVASHSVVHSKIDKKKS